MTLISILVGLALEYSLGSLDRLRNFAWFDYYRDRLEGRCRAYGFWDGAGGVLLTLALPLALLAVLAQIVSGLSFLFSFLFVTAVFIYSLGPALNHFINSYLEALEAEDETAIRQAEQAVLPTGQADEDAILRAILLRAHDSVFGVIFWFIVLGIYGALLFCLVLRLRQRLLPRDDAYAAAVVRLYFILMWPSALLLALGFALSGSLVDALEGWHKTRKGRLDSGAEAIFNTGLGALQYAADKDASGSTQSAQVTQSAQAARIAKIEWVKQLQSLLQRTLIICLTALGILTLGGWLA